MSQAQDLTGIWRSRYTYKSSKQPGQVMFSEHVLKAYRRGDWINLETIQGENESYLLIRIHIDDDIATGNWQEQTAADGQYGGAMYFGGVQFVLDATHQHMRGQWVGIDSGMNINDGPWELEYIGQQPDASVRSKPPRVAQPVSA